MNISISTNITPLNAGLFVSSGRGTHPTRIIDSHELIYVASGTLEIFEEKEKYRLQKGESVIFYPDCRHGGLADYPPDLSFYWIHFFVGNGGDIQIPKMTKIREADRLISFFRMYLDEQERAGEMNKQFGACLIALMLLELSQKATVDLSNSVQAAKAKLFIDVNFRKKLSTHFIARNLECNPDYLGRIFMKKYNTSITQYIHKKKIAAAIRLLLESNLNINEISEDLSFSDSAYFRRVFKKNTGLTPARYRKMYSHIYVNTE